MTRNVATEYTTGQQTSELELSRPAGIARGLKFGSFYDATNWHMTAQYLREALPANQRIDFDLSVLKPNVNLDRLFLAASSGGSVPDVILHETGTRGLPGGLTEISIPTACLDIDTFGWTSFRLQWAMLFDYVFTWHPSYVRLFQAQGHPRVFALPHAVDGRLFSEVDHDSDRPYDLGFVGNFGLPQYVKRDRVNSRLATRFQTNDFRRKYSKQETTEVYRRARVVVNVSRMEFPSEANMRCYEAMAGGALLITGIPTELTEWGFREGEHFIGWRSEEEIPGLVDQFLERKEQRLAIARAGHELTLKDFTYQRCIEAISETIARDGGQLFAPARHWPADKVRLIYLSYYYRLQITCAALEEFRLLRSSNPRAFWKGLPLVLKTVRHALKRCLW